jgi:hypothetical protein
MILQRLREQTHASHKRLESRFNRLERALFLDRYWALPAHVRGSA